MRRWIAHFLTVWLLLLVPGATALALARPQQWLPACCRSHGVHHCSVAAHARDNGPSWRAERCPYAHMQRAALVLPCFITAQQATLAAQDRAPFSPAMRLAVLSSHLAGLPGSRAPPLPL